MARQIGVTVQVTGELPKGGQARVWIAQAIDQCAANAVRHAGGDRLTLKVTQSDALVTAEFSNNGSPPKGPIVETGGLAALRRAIESAGGRMLVQSEPAFLLCISLPAQS